MARVYALAYKFGYLFAGLHGYGGIVKTANNGVNWQVSNQGFGGATPSAIHTTLGGYILMATLLNGLFLHTR